MDTVLSIVVFSLLSMKVNNNNKLKLDGYVVGRYARLLEIEVWKLQEVLDELNELGFTKLKDEELMVNPSVFSKCSILDVGALKYEYDT
jgi:hypothetical protein